MPIKPENRERYPADWDTISRDAKDRAGWRCQHPGCTARQYAVGQWLVQGVTANWIEHGHVGRDLPDAYKQARQMAAEIQLEEFGDDPVAPKIIVIVLTTAHLDHDPENCAPGNLAALCQRHHLQYDQQHHKQNAYASRMTRRGNMELPL